MPSALIEYDQASPEVRAVYDDIMSTRKIASVNNFWKALARNPDILRKSWESVKTVMAAGQLDALTKELIYLAVSATNECAYCLASHSASARNKGMSDEIFGEFIAVVGLANQNNALAAAYQVPIDEQFKV